MYFVRSTNRWVSGCGLHILGYDNPALNPTYETRVRWQLVELVFNTFDKPSGRGARRPQPLQPDQCYNPLMDYRRVFVPGGTYFFTLVTYQRQPIFSTPEAVDLLQNAFRYALKQKPFTIVASVILPDHIHCIWTLPPENSDFSTRWRLIKSHFTRNWCTKESISQTTSRINKGEKDVWQRRFWEHLIRNDLDLSRHVEYIHNNPVKHGLVNSPGDWKQSSFMKYARDGIYPLDWGGNEKIWEG